MVQFKSIHHVVKDLAHHPDDPQKLNIIGSAVKELGDTLPEVPAETLHCIVMSAGNDVIPVNTCPIRSENCRQKAAGICGILCGLPGIKAPGKHRYTYLIDIRKLLHMNPRDSTFSRRFRSTTLYFDWCTIHC